MENANAKKIPDDEIDFGSIVRRLYSFFIYPLTLLSKNKLITFCFLLFGIISSAGFKYLLPKTYSSSFVIRSVDPSDKIYLKILNDLPALIKNGDKKTLASILGLDSSLVANLVQIKIKLSDITKGDSTNTIDIKIESLNNQMILPVQTSILHYLENNPYYTKIRNLQKNQIELKLLQIDKDLVQLDSLKKLQLAAYDKQKLNSQYQLALNDLINPTAVYNTGTDLMNKKSALIAQTVFIDRFQLIKSCVISSRHSWPPRILVLCLFFVPFSLIVCVIFLHAKSSKSEVLEA
jgi:hypothetical protein